MGVWTILILVFGTVASGATQEITVPDRPCSSRPGLYVENGMLKNEGKTYAAIGVNYHDAFVRYLTDPNNTTSFNGLRELSEQYQIPLIRFRLGGYWPNEWKKYYLEDKNTYFKRLDEFVRCAETYHIGLIPSFFWYAGAVPDVVGEPMDQYGNPDSRTSQFIRQFTAEVVERYCGSPAILGWEFGNEYILEADLPGKEQGIPKIVPSLGTASTRTSRDKFNRTIIYAAYRTFEEAVRRMDSHRVILTGDSCPRPSSWHLVHQQGWTRDTRQQFEEILRQDTPAGFDMIAIHLYASDDNVFFETRASIEDLVSDCRAVSLQSKKPLFIGEFGAPESLGNDKVKDYIQRFLKLILDNNIPLAAVWVYDYSPQEGDWNITSQNNRSFILALIQQANAKR